MGRIDGTKALAGKDPSHGRLHGRWLALARTLWLGMAAVTLVLFALSVPSGFTLLRTMCTDRRCGPEQLRPEGARAIRELGLSLEAYAAYQTALVVVFALVFCALAAVVFWRRSDEVMALYTSLTLVLSGVFLPDWIGIELLVSVYPYLWLPLNFLNTLMFGCLFILFYIFPDGRFVPRWALWTALVWIVLLGAHYVVPVGPLNPNNWSPALLATVVATLIGTCLFAQVYRYRRVSGSPERRQTKWVVLGLTTMLAVLVLATVPPYFGPSLDDPGSLYDLVVDFASFLAVLLVPVMFGIVILRYRLFDIDVLINRTLVYGALSISLALVYVGTVVGLQYVFRSFAGEGSTLAVVASTLLIATLFSPLRRRIQDFMDRRFYRRKYDAAKTLESFGLRLRSETDLDSLGEGLAVVVRETVQPAHVSLWLREQGPRDGHATGATSEGNLQDGGGRS
jgi:hypothetical protein